MIPDPSFAQNGETQQPLLVSWIRLGAGDGVGIGRDVLVGIGMATAGCDVG